MLTFDKDVSIYFCQNPSKSACASVPRITENNHKCQNKIAIWKSFFSDNEKSAHNVQVFSNLMKKLDVCSNFWYNSSKFAGGDFHDTKAGVSWFSHQL